METGRNVMHYALGDNQDYEHEWSKAVLEYLENGYSSEDSKSEVEVGNTTYKIQFGSDCRGRKYAPRISKAAATFRD